MSRSPARRLALVAGLFLVAAVPAAGAASKPLSVVAYRGHADAICRQEQQSSVAWLHESKSLAQYLTKVTPVIRTALAGLTAIVPPPKLASLHTQIVSTVRREAALFATLARRANAGKLTNAQWENDPQVAQLDSRELALWKRVGATSCASP